VVRSSRQVWHSNRGAATLRRLAAGAMVVGSSVAVDGVGGWKLDSTGIDKTRAIRQGCVGHQLHVKGRDRMVHVIIVG
jgi:hypothetical protein